jgi:GLPGLI family protein
MRKILLFIFLFTFFKGSAQESVEVRYFLKKLSFEEVNTINYTRRQVPREIRLFFNDSVAFYYMTRLDGANPLRNRQQIGDKLVHHGCYRNYNTGEHYDEVVWPEGNKYLIKDSVPGYNWTFYDTHKKILKKDCAAALSVNEKNDSILVWYTTDLPYLKGQLGYNNIPGVIMQVDDQVRDVHIKAFRIKKNSKKIVRPAEGLVVSRRQWAEIRKKIPIPIHLF